MRIIALFTLMTLGHACQALGQNAPDSVVAGKLQFEKRVLATDLDGPWELIWGPDNFLWVTERKAGRITRINPADGSKITAIQIAEVSARGGQDGLMGMALHPELLKGAGHDYVFAAYTYADKSRGPVPYAAQRSGPYRYLYAKIVRLTYDQATGKLNDPVDVIAGLPASSDHNSGRLKIGPDLKLYYSIGDGGNNQHANACTPIEAQRLPTAKDLEASSFVAYQGKSLRINLDGSVPVDNPLINGVRSHVFTYGHRNMQGLDFAPDGTLYASEHGPKSDDEINILLPGENYGWPHVAGFRDNKAYQYARWADASTPCRQLKFSDITIDASVPREDESTWTEDFQEPLATMFTVPTGWNFTDPACKGVDFICWPTVGPSSLETYMPKSGGIPGWENSLIVPTLKRGSLYRIPLTADGRKVRGPIERYFQSESRYRDTALSPDMKTIYVATDPGGIAESLTGGTTSEMQNPGAILVFTFKP